MTDKAKAYVRTVWPVLLGHVAAYLIAAGRPLGLHLDSAVAFELAGFLCSTAVYVAGSELEQVRGTGRLARWSRGLGRLVLSLGLDIGRPAYPVFPYGR
jgi:hypothetical protein